MKILEIQVRREETASLLLEVPDDFDTKKLSLAAITKATGKTVTEYEWSAEGVSSYCILGIVDPDDVACFCKASLADAGIEEPQ